MDFDDFVKKTVSKKVEIVQKPFVFLYDFSHRKFQKVTQVGMA